MKHSLDITEKEERTNNPPKRCACGVHGWRFDTLIHEPAADERDARRERRLRDTLLNLVLQPTYKDAIGTVTRLWRSTPDIGDFREELERHQGGHAGCVQAYIDTLPIYHGFKVVSSTFSVDKIVDLMAGHSPLSAFMFAPEDIDLLLVDRENDECLFSITHGPERELEFESTEALLAHVYEEVNPDHRKNLCLSAVESGDEELRPRPRTWLSIPDIRRDEAPPALLSAIASAVVECGFFVMTGEGACARNRPRQGVSSTPEVFGQSAYSSTFNLRYPGFLPRANLYMRVKGVSAILK